jgi:long-chain fatty acid transport protein
MQMTKKIADTRDDGIRFGFIAKLVFAAALAIFVLMANNAMAGGFALSGVGSKAINMGGAFRGLADDWSAAYWNPAGLTQVEHSEVNAMLVAITPKPEFTPNIYHYGHDVGYRNGKTLYNNEQTKFALDASGFMKFKKLRGIVAGIAVYVPYGLGSEWDLYNPVNLDLTNQFPWYDHKADLYVIDIHPTIAKAFMEDKLSLGAGISMQRGSVTFQKTYLKSSGVPVPHENLIIDSEMTGDGWGFGANFGALYKFSNKLQFGVSGRTSSTIKLDGKADQELYTYNNEDLRNILLSQARTAADTARILFLFSPDNHLASPKVKSDFKTPGDIGFGIAIKPSEKLTITGDIAYTFWGSIDSIYLELEGTDPSGAPAQNTAIMLNWDNTLRFSFGAEYCPIKPLALRLGYYFDPTPVPDETFTPLIPDSGDKNSYNFGAALKMKGMELSYNFEYLMFKDRTITTSDDVNNDGNFDNYPGVFKAKLYASHVSLTYKF